MKYSTKQYFNLHCSVLLLTMIFVSEMEGQSFGASRVFSESQLVLGTGSTSDTGINFKNSSSYIDQQWWIYKNSSNLFFTTGRDDDNGDVFRDHRMVMRSNGNVGIGTTNPESSLQVSGNLAISPIQPGVHIGNDSNGNSSFSLVSGGSGNSGYASYIDFGPTGTDYQARIRHQNGDYFQFTNNGDMRFDIGGTRILHLENSNKNLGILTADPKAKLHVNGTIIAGARNTNPNSTSFNASESLIIPGTTSDYIISTQDGNGRVQHKWNATSTFSGGTQNYITSGERAGMIEFDPSTTNEVFAIKWADAGTAGNQISFNNLLKLTSTGNLEISGDLIANSLTTEDDDIHTDHNDIPVSKRLLNSDQNDAPHPVNTHFAGKVYLSGDANLGAVRVSQQLFNNFHLILRGSSLMHDIGLATTGDWGADYVFDKDYELISLEKLEKYLEEHKHLPDVVSANEGRADGYYSLEKMVMGQLKNLEEQVLHNITQQKRINEQNEELKRQDAIIRDLIARIEVLEKTKN